MVEKFEHYLGVLPLTQVVKTRIDEILILNDAMIDEDIVDIFICELKNNEERTTFTSLWLFTESYATECKNFLTTYDFDIAPYKNKINYCSIKATEFDFTTPTEKSLVTISFQFDSPVSGTFTATSDNCLKAYEFYTKYIIPNVVK
jgi:hypothetical protein